MAEDFAITGAQDFADFAKALRQAGQGGLKRAMVKGLKEGAKPISEATKAAARERLPKKGGLNERVASAPQTVRVKQGRDPAVRLVAGKKGSGAVGADKGEVRHPTWHTGTYAVTNVPPGWFTQTGADHIADALPALERALDSVIQEVIRHG